MALKISYSTTRGYYISGQHPSLERYERDIMSGKIPAPYTCEFRNVDGDVVTRSPIPLRSNGKPKINLF